MLGIDILRDRAMRDYVVASLAAPVAAATRSRTGSRGRGSEAGSTRRPGDDGAPGDDDVTVQTAGAPLTSQQFLAILTSPQSVVITEKLARRRGYAVGDEIRLMTGDRLGTYVVRALLEDSGPARVMDGSFVLMDIAAAQLAFDRLGRLDRIDVQIAAHGHGARCLADADGRGDRRRGGGDRRPPSRPDSRPDGRRAAVSRSSGCSPHST